MRRSGVKLDGAFTDVLDPPAPASVMLPGRPAVIHAPSVVMRTMPNNAARPSVELTSFRPANAGIATAVSAGRVASPVEAAVVPMALADPVVRPAPGIAAALAAPGAAPGAPAPPPPFPLPLPLGALSVEAQGPVTGEAPTLAIA